MATFEYRQAEEIREAFARHGVRYLFIGKSGAILLGYPDTTQEAVLLLEKLPGNDAAVRALRELGFKLSDVEAADAPADYWMLWRADRDEAPALLRAVRTARGRWPIEQDYRELKEELGLDHFEGRGWPGWHHHVTLVTLAFAFLRSEQLRFKKNFTCQLTDDPSPPAGGAYPDGRSMSVVPDEIR